MVNFLAEDNIASEIVNCIRVRPDCQVQQFPLGMRSNTEDPGDLEVRKYSNDHQSILVACDLDFIDLSVPQYRVCNNTGTLLLRITPQDARHVLGPLRKLLGSPFLSELYHAICELFDSYAILTTPEGRFKLEGDGRRFRTKIPV